MVNLGITNLPGYHKGIATRRYTANDKQPKGKIKIDEDWSYLILNDSDRSEFGRKYLSPMGFGILIKHFANNYNLEKVIVDGDMSREQKNIMHNVVNHNGVRIENIAKADVTYPLVNSADAIARMLFHAYTNDPQFKDKQSGNLPSKTFINKRVYFKSRGYTHLVP